MDVRVSTANVPSLPCATVVSHLPTGTGNVLLIYLWGSDVGPWMQFMHFCFGVGAFVAPLLMRMMEAIVLHGQVRRSLAGPERRPTEGTER